MEYKLNSTLKLICCDSLRIIFQHLIIDVMSGSTYFPYKRYENKKKEYSIYAVSEDIVGTHLSYSPDLNFSMKSFLSEFFTILTILPLCYFNYFFQQFISSINPIF